MPRAEGQESGAVFRLVARTDSLESGMAVSGWPEPSVCGKDATLKPTGMYLRRLGKGHPEHSLKA